MPITTLFASSDFHVNPDGKGGYIFSDRKEGHIEAILDSFEEYKKENRPMAFINPGDALETGTNCNLFDFQFIKNSKNLLRFGLSDELGGFKKLVAERFDKAGLQELDSEGNHDRTKDNWTDFFSFFSKATEKTINTLGDPFHLKVSLPTEKFPRNAFGEYLAKRHGNKLYYKTVGDVYVVCLGVYPDKYALQWMKNNVPNDKPIVPFWHYNVDGPFSVEGTLQGGWWSKKERENAFDLFSNHYTTIAVIVGHLHSSYAYTFTAEKEIPIFLVGGVRFLELSIDSDDNFKINANYHYGKGADPLKISMA